VLSTPATQIDADILCLALMLVLILQVSTEDVRS
jgi:hypothetical protein